MKLALHKKEFSLLWVFMAVHLVFKLVLLVWGGPMRFPDTEGYLRYAQQITASSEWLGALDLHREFLPVSIWRMPGYPLVVAAFQMMVPQFWDTALVFAQSLFSVLMSGVLLVFLLKMGVCRWLALGAVAWQALSVRPLMDLTLLTDSLYNNLMLLVLLGLSWPGKPENNGLFKAVLAGVVYALALLLRETAWVFMPFVAAGYFFVEGVGRSSLKKMVVFMLPPLLVVTTLQLWNRHRTGTAFLTLGPATALMQPIMLIGKTPFDQNTPLDEVARRRIQQRTYPEVMVALREVHEKYGLTALEINGLVTKKFKRSLAANPLGYARYSAVNLAYSSGLLLNLWQGVRHVQGKILSDRGQPQAPIPRGSLAFWLGPMLFFVLSMVLLGCFLVGGLVFGSMGFMARGPLPQTVAGAVLWWVLLGGGMMFTHSLINIEARYLGVLSALAPCGVALLMSALRPVHFSANPEKFAAAAEGQPPSNHQP